MISIANLPLDQIGIWVAFVLTLMIFSYVIHDNPLYRLAQHILVGSVAGYALVVAYHSVLRPRLVMPMIENPVGNPLLLIPILLSAMLVLKSRRSLAGLGNTALGYMFGVGAALAIAGALIGTLATQIEASWLVLHAGGYTSEPISNVVSAVLIILGTTGTLMYFYYGQSSASAIGRGVGAMRMAWGQIGKWFILIALGAIFGSLMIARVSLLIGRIRFLLDTLGI